MRFLKTLNETKASNFRFEHSNNNAWSYGHWLFSTEVNDLLIFNNSRYSSSTQRHQSKARGLLTKLPNLILSFTTESLESLETALESEVRGIEYEIKEVYRQTQKKGTQKSKNKERIALIGEYVNRIREVRKFSINHLQHHIDSNIVFLQRNTLTEKFKNYVHIGEYSVDIEYLK